MFNSLAPLEINNNKIDYIRLVLTKKNTLYVPSNEINDSALRKKCIKQLINQSHYSPLTSI